MYFTQWFSSNLCIPIVVYHNTLSLALVICLRQEKSNSYDYCPSAISGLFFYFILDDICTMWYTGFSLCKRDTYASLYVKGIEEISQKKKKEQRDWRDHFLCIILLDKWLFSGDVQNVLDISIFDCRRYAKKRWETKP